MVAYSCILEPAVWCLVICLSFSVLHFSLNDSVGWVSNTLYGIAATSILYVLTLCWMIRWWMFQDISSFAEASEMIHSVWLKLCADIGPQRQTHPYEYHAELLAQSSAPVLWVRMTLAPSQ